ncbi:MAG: FAD-dependent oxidoreductase [Candidatus Eremiobacteraeota bacterium]|nr:FAD-dependent oxidoreductase [Candidatus Eremiobacteraeota bacterium]
MTRCAIVGGGILGMTLALRMARCGWAVTLYEQNPELGGLAAPWRIGGITWDRHYHVMLRSDTALLALLAELGLERDVVWARARTNFFIDGSMHPFTSTLDQLRFPAIGMVDKARLALMVRRAQRRKDWRELENVDVETWLRHECGDHVFERIWLPLLLAKLGSAYHRSNAAFIWATIQRLYVAAQHGRAQQFGYVQGGYRRIIEALSAALVHEGVRVRAATAIQDVRSEKEAFAVETIEGSRTYDRVIMTQPAPAIARVASALSGEERDRLRSIEYQGAVCASVLLDRRLGDSYITNIADPEIPFTAAIEMSALVDPEAFGHRHLVYLPRYCTPRDPFFVLGDAEMRLQSMIALRRMYPGFKAEDIRAFRVSRVPAVFALPVVGYSGQVPGFMTSCPGLYIATSAQIVNGTLNVNETLVLARQAAEAIARDARFTSGGIRETAR